MQGKFVKWNVSDYVDAIVDIDMQVKAAKEQGNHDKADFLAERASAFRQEFKTDFPIAYKNWMTA